MFRTLITYFFFIIPFLNFSQENEIDEKYKNETIKFLSDLKGKIEIDSNTVIINKPITIKDCFERLLINSEELTNDEKSEIKNKIEQQSKFEWTKDFIENIKIIEYSQYKKVFKDDKNGWKKFRKKYGESILRFSKPIFLRDYSVCVFSYSLSFDYLSGYGFTGYYKKENGNWKAFGLICSYDL